jgi:hypothetical protein
MLSRCHSAAVSGTPVQAGILWYAPVMAGPPLWLLDRHAADAVNNVNELTHSTNPSDPSRTDSDAAVAARAGAGAAKRCEEGIGAEAIIDVYEMVRRVVARHIRCHAKCYSPSLDEPLDKYWSGRTPQSFVIGFL